jgi:hypothetical protein
MTRVFPFNMPRQTTKGLKTALLPWAPFPGLSVFPGVRGQRETPPLKDTVTDNPKRPDGRFPFHGPKNQGNPVLSPSPFHIVNPPTDFSEALC